MGRESSLDMNIDRILSGPGKIIVHRIDNRTFYQYMMEHELIDLIGYGICMISMITPILAMIFCPYPIE